MSLPDSGWITSLQNLPWWVLAGIAAGMGCLRALGNSGIWIEGPGVVALSLLLFQMLDRWNESKRNRIRRRFKRLDERQQKFLIDRYNSGSRRFELPTTADSNRWMEELQKWNYIEWISPIVLVPIEGFTYYVTEHGWVEIQKHVKRGSGT